MAGEDRGVGAVDRGVEIGRLIQNTRRTIPTDDVWILLFDFGGGHCSVSLAVVRMVDVPKKTDQECVVEIKAKAGNDRLGGEDFTNCLVDYCIVIFQRQHRNDLEGNAQALYRLYEACESAKCRLSLSKIVVIKLDNLDENRGLSTTITRTLFEDLCSDYFQTISQPRLSTSVRGWHSAVGRG